MNNSKNWIETHNEKRIIALYRESIMLCHETPERAIQSVVWMTGKDEVVVRDVIKNQPLVYQAESESDEMPALCPPAEEDSILFDPPEFHIADVRERVLDDSPSYPGKKSPWHAVLNLVSFVCNRAHPEVDFSATNFKGEWNNAILTGTHIESQEKDHWRFGEKLLNHLTDIEDALYKGDPLPAPVGINLRDDGIVEIVEDTDPLPPCAPPPATDEKAAPGVDILKSGVTLKQEHDTIRDEHHPSIETLLRAKISEQEAEIERLKAERDVSYRAHQETTLRLVDTAIDMATRTDDRSWHVNYLCAQKAQLVQLMERESSSSPETRAYHDNVADKPFVANEDGTRHYEKERVVYPNGESEKTPVKNAFINEDALLVGTAPRFDIEVVYDDCADEWTVSNLLLWQSATERRK